MQTGGIVIAVQVFQGKVEMGKGMSAINQNGNIFFAAQMYHLFHRQDLAGNINHMTHEDQFCFWCNIFLKEFHDLIIIFSRYWNGKLPDCNPFPAFPLFKCIDHSRVILGGGQYFITRIKVKTILQDLQSLGGVTGKCHFLRITLKESGQSLSNGFSLRFKDPPHGVCWRCVGIIKVPFHGFLYNGRCRTNTAVVQIYHAAVCSICLLNIKPK